MTVLTSKAVSEAQKHSVPPKLRRIVCEYCRGVTGFTRYQSEHIIAGVNFECDMGEFGRMMRELRDNFQVARLGHIRHLDEKIFVQVRFE